MNHSHKKEILKKVNTLLKQYDAYNLANTAQEKEIIGDEMKYADPIIWMMYKHKAYLNSNHAILTFKDLKHHCVDHGGICAKRFNFLRQSILEIYKKDILDTKIFKDSMSIEDFYTDETLEDLVLNQKFMDTWTLHEYHEKNGKVAKWDNYICE